MVERRTFVCDSCGTRVTAGSYRATCPDCGGTLSQKPETGFGGDP